MTGAEISKPPPESQYSVTVTTTIRVGCEDCPGRATLVCPGISAVELFAGTDSTGVPLLATEETKLTQDGEDVFAHSQEVEVPRDDAMCDPEACPPEFGLAKLFLAVNLAARAKVIRDSSERTE